MYDFRVVAGGVVRREQRKLRTACGRNLDHLPAEEFAGILVDADLRWVSDFHVCELRLTVICLHPLDVADESDYLCSGGDQLSRPHLSFAYTAITRSSVLRVSEVHLSDGEGSLFGVEICDELNLLRLENRLGAPLSLDRKLIAPQQRFRLFKISLTTRQLGSKPLFIGDHLLNFLLRA